MQLCLREFCCLPNVCCALYSLNWLYRGCGWQDCYHIVNMIAITSRTLFQKIWTWPIQRVKSTPFKEISTMMTSYFLLLYLRFIDMITHLDGGSVLLHCCSTGETVCSDLTIFFWNLMFINCAPKDFRWFYLLF